jgi:acetyltransferase EpsM
MNEKLTPVLIPLLNPNEPEANLISLKISEGQYISSGQVICTLETTKSAADVVAERDGFVIGLSFSAGDTVHAGEILCYLADSSEKPYSIPKPNQGTSPSLPAALDLPEGLRITQPALEFVRRENIDIGQLPKGPLITESFFHTYTGKTMDKSKFSLIDSEFDPRPLVIYGGGGHGKMLIDLLRALNVYRIVGIVDDGLKPGTEVMSIPVLGNADILPNLATKGVKMAINAVGGIGNVNVRIEVFKKLADNGFVCPPIVHPSATIEKSSTLSPGVQIFAKAYIGSEAQIKYGVIVNTGAIISHDCILDDYAIISPGAIIAGEVHIGKGSLIGMAATINLRVKIGDRVRIGNGATVKGDVPDSGIVKAGSIWPAI